MAVFDMHQIQREVGILDYPIKKNDILNLAREHGANQTLVGFLEKIPDREYTSSEDISTEVNQVVANMSNMFGKLM